MRSQNTAIAMCTTGECVGLGVVGTVELRNADLHPRLPGGADQSSRVKPVGTPWRVAGLAARATARARRAGGNLRARFARLYSASTSSLRQAAGEIALACQQILLGAGTMYPEPVLVPTHRPHPQRVRSLS